MQERICSTLLTAVCFLQLSSALGAAEPAPVRLAISEGKDIRFTRVTSKDGLPAGQIRDIVQDDQGFMWFNTQVFLNRFDGYRFKSYTRDPGHPNYPAGGFVQFVFKDRSGFLWVSSNESLDRFDPATESTTRFKTDGNGPKSVLGPVLHISQDRAGIMWLSTAAGLHRLDPTSGAIRHYSHDPADPGALSNPLVTSTFEDREGTLWVSTAAGLDAFDRRTERVTERIRLNVPDPLSVKALEDHAGVLWIIYLSTGSASGLASWDRRTRRLTMYSFTGREPPSSQLSGPVGIHEDADGNLWLATRGNGLVKIDPARRSAVRYRHSALDPDSISEDILMSVFEDREGSIWVGAVSTGLNRFQRKPLPFKRYRHETGNPQSLLRTSVTSVYADSHDNIWVGSSIGLTRIDGKTGRYTFFQKAGPAPANLSNIFVISIVEDRSGYLWFGTYGGLNRYDPRTGRFAAFRHNPADPQSLSHDVVYSLMVDRQGTLWAGTADGLSRCEDPATGRFRSWKAGTSPQQVSAIIEDSSRILWLVSGTLQRFDPATGRFTAYTLDPFDTRSVETENSPTLVRTGKLIENGSLTIDRSGALWLATGNGLVRFDRGREQFTTYDQREGLPASSIHAILEDRTGDLWVSTAGGLSRLDPRTKAFTNYYEADGLAGSAFEGYSAACVSRRGQMFFGSKSGLTAFWPEQIVEKPTAPPVVLTGFWLRNVPVPPGAGSVLAKSITFTPSLTLSHDQNMFSFEFAALSYVDPARNQYRYMLEPLDRSWNHVDADRRVAAFTTLPTGSYSLRVQGSNDRGVWNEQGVVLHLHILPPWWATWQFRALWAAIALTMLGAAWQYRVRQLRREVRQLHNVIETIPAMAWTVRPDGSGAFVNRRWTEYTGLSAEETTGTGWTAAVHPEDRQQYWDLWSASLAAGEPFDDEARFRCAADGAYRWFLARGVPLRDKHGTIVRWYGVLTDIEDRKRAEDDREKLRQIEAELAHINRVSMMGELTASIAHEVNQPLSGIVSNGSACLRWLAGDPPDVEEAREAARDIVRDGKRAGEVIARIRALTKRTAPPKEELDLNNTVREVLALVGDELKRHSVQVRTRFASDLAWVSADRVQLQQVILNLIMNATEAMSGVEDRARELTISTLNADADQVRVSVTDSGPGLDPNMGNRIFEPFFTTKASGMGLGLSICRSIVQNHGGRLWVSTDNGPGTTFHFTLPQGRQEEVQADRAAV